MLNEIFYRLGENILEYFETKRVSTKKTRLLLGPAAKGKGGRLIRIELLRFGRSPEQRNFPLHEQPGDKSFYIFTFFIIVDRASYEDCLLMTEMICDYMDKQPFMQMKINEREYEVAFSSLELTIDQLNQFWLAQDRPHQPVMFYQARISEI